MEQTKGPDPHPKTPSDTNARFGCCFIRNLLHEIRPLRSNAEYRDS
ncbi:hypothetical protein THF1C08_30228 [Vibrio jasicida]|uniref:Uncharacterized protein n=1 Tax=Vibrio jasicida TaxID=766224 RepID=A0AAU9QTK0_9VIBR|nr:hypothetical protein THF1C08_30228 [Vibrio jasicida]CAH1599597.1 hypothetical protein THF1A12_40207 [Vibrio jasicida]